MDSIFYRISFLTHSQSIALSLFRYEDFFLPLENSKQFTLRARVSDLKICWLENHGAIKGIVMLSGSGVKWTGKTCAFLCNSIHVTHAKPTVTAYLRLASLFSQSFQCTCTLDQTLDHFRVL